MSKSSNYTFMIAIVVAILVTFFVTKYFSRSNTCWKDRSQKALPEHSPTKTKVYRLPDNVIPINYALQIQPFMQPDQLTFNGSVEVLINCQKSTNVIQMNANELEIDRSSIFVRKSNNDDEHTATFIKIDEFEYKDEVITLRLGQNLIAGTNYTVFVAFKGDLKTGIIGFYKSSYLDAQTNKTRYTALAHFEPTFARKAFPCWDEPGFKATFEIEVIHWLNMSCISNMPEIKAEQVDAEWKKSKFYKTVKMSTYLVTFAIGDFKFKDNLENVPEFRVITRPSEIETAMAALDMGPKILDFFEDYFSIKFPLPKLDLLATPDFSSGATEDFGLILFRESLLLYNEDVGSITELYRVCSVISHEISHSWFGNLVTMDWWQGLWLNEGFATYASYLSVEYLKPEWRAFEKFVTDELQDVMRLDSLKNTHPISVEVNNPSEINQIFDRISYAKAASIIRMLTFVIGQQTFKEGLKNYLIAFQYGNAHQNDLWKHLQDVTDRDSPDAKIDVKKMMDSWTLNEGYPLITITRDYNTSEVHFSQRRFLLNCDDDVMLLKSQYEVPITFTYKSEQNWSPHTKFWLHKINKSESKKTIKENISNDDWLIANLQEVGFYRVNYDEQNWRLLIKQLKNDPILIDRINRLQILDDLFHLAENNVVTYNLALEALEYLNNEKDALPWTSIGTLTMKIETMLRRSELYGAWQEYMRTLIKYKYEQIQLSELGDNLIDNQLQKTIANVACAYDLESCVKSSKELFDSFMTNRTGINEIPRNVRSIVYCTTIRNGDEIEWNFIYELYLKEQNANERNAMLSALTCSRIPWIITRYLNWTFDEKSGIKAQDSEFVFRQLAKQNYSKEIAFNFMRENWRTIHAHLSGRQFDTIFKWFDTMNSPFELDQMKQFYNQVSSKVGSSRPFLQTIESIEANIRWMKRSKAEIVEFLRNYHS